MPFDVQQLGNMRMPATLNVGQPRAPVMGAGGLMHLPAIEVPHVLVASSAQHARAKLFAADSHTLTPH
jgi:hypothetical protein